MDRRAIQNMISEVQSEIRAKLLGMEQADQERSQLTSRLEALDQTELDYAKRVDSLYPYLEWLNSELENAPPLSPDIPLQTAIESLIARYPDIDRDEVIEMLDPAYFPDGIDSTVKQSISMYMTHARKRMGDDESRAGTSTLDVILEDDDDRKRGIGYMGPQTLSPDDLPF